MVRVRLGIGLVYAVFVAHAASAQMYPACCGATPYAGVLGTGVTFRVWAGNATSVHVAASFNNFSTTTHPLSREGSSQIWSRNFVTAQPGDRYKFVLNGTIWKRDPRGARVIHAGDTDSIVHDHSTYTWQSGPFTPPSPENLVIYEMHIGTFHRATPDQPAGLDEARAQLDYLAELGINAVELMPVTEFPGTHSWGYNPTDLYAVDNVTYGGPDALKRFVDAAHQRGIAVLLDLVHNHYGSADLPGDLVYSLWEYDGTSGTLGGGPYFYQDAAKAHTPWGRRPNYSNTYVRDFIKDNARVWLREYRIDGFRWDATRYMRLTTNGTTITEGRTLLQEVNALIRSEFTNKISIAEDLDHLASTTASAASGGLAFDSDWHTGFHHALTEEIAKSTGLDLYRVRDALNYTSHTRRVIFTESHDEVGHPEYGQVRVPVTMDADNPTSLTARRKSNLAAGLMLIAPGIPMLFQGQEFLTTTPFDDTHALDWSRTNTHAGIVRFYQDAIRLRQNRLGITGGLTGSNVTASVEQLANDPSHALLTIHRRHQGGAGDDVFVVANLSNNPVPDDWITWPSDGTWYAVLNSDGTRYGQDFGNYGSASSFVYGDLRGSISIAPWSLIIFARSPPPDAYTGMAIPGAYNGWSTAPTMRKVQDHEWEQDLALTATNAFTFKFAANNGWEHNWGMGTLAAAEPFIGSVGSQGGNFAIAIPTSATYRFRFNTANGAFSVRNIAPVPRGTRHPAMSFAANVNGYNLTPTMKVNEDGRWTTTITLNQSWALEFKFAAYGTYSVSWGGSGVAEQDVPLTTTALAQASENLTIEGPLNGDYVFTFDDFTGAFTVTRVLSEPFWSAGVPHTTQDNRLVLTWENNRGSRYDILHTTNLLAGRNGFVTIASNLTTDAAFNSYTVTVSQTEQDFYRIIGR